MHAVLVRGPQNHLARHHAKVMLKQCAIYSFTPWFSTRAHDNVSFSCTLGFNGWGKSYNCYSEAIMHLIHEIEDLKSAVKNKKIQKMLRQLWVICYIDARFHSVLDWGHTHGWSGDYWSSGGTVSPTLWSWSTCPGDPHCLSVPLSPSTFGAVLAGLLHEGTLVAFSLSPSSTFKVSEDCCGCALVPGVCSLDWSWGRSVHKEKKALNNVHTPITEFTASVD